MFYFRTFCVCETFANDKISNAYLKLVGYEIIVRQDGKDTKDGRTRGLIVYSREGLQAYEYQVEGAKSFTECVGISVPWGKGKGQELKLVLVYRPPAPPGGPKDGITQPRCVSPWLSWRAML